MPTRLRAYVRPAASKDSLPMAYDNPALQDGAEQPDLTAGGLSQAVNDFLLKVDAKLDTVISLLNQKRLEDEFTSDLEVIEIGGDGLRLIEGSSFTPGDALEFALVLNQFPLRIASAVGVLAQDDSAEGHPVTFTRIREPDLEAIVSYVFQEQRMRIRETKWSD
ncbi:PilZ domain-containing protein [Desulfovibrio ferrophilus]|uniref:PilZ domain-containing protein n=1 Tax=Desulfovibrio ferrophilus TaxID=241368 RepID=UPI000F838161|nr:PilZ domain-containing protein [Desulfovibrio ferrophilus]